MEAPTKSHQPADKLSTKPSPELPADQYLCRLVDYHDTGYPDDAYEHWHTPLFHFVRYLKAHPAFTNKTAPQAIEAIETLMKVWNKQKPTAESDSWKRWLGVARDDAHAELYGAWDAARYLPGYDPLQNAVQRAQHMRLLPTPEQQAKRPPKYVDFVSIAGWLQVVMGNRPIMLPVEKLDKILGVEPITISRYRQWAIQDGFLKEVKPYQFHGKGKPGKATEFVFDVSQWKPLREAAEKGTAESFAAV